MISYKRLSFFRHYVQHGRFGLVENKGKKPLDCRYEKRLITVFYRLLTLLRLRLPLFSQKCDLYQANI